jgi:hypothetical protein
VVVGESGALAGAGSVGAADWLATGPLANGGSVGIGVDVGWGDDEHAARTSSAAVAKHARDNAERWRMPSMPSFPRPAVYDPLGRGLGAPVEATIYRVGCRA